MNGEILLPPFKIYKILKTKKMRNFNVPDEAFGDVELRSINSQLKIIKKNIY